MFILRIEHPIPDFNIWKEAFDSDPIDRKKSGVRRYRISQQVDNEQLVSIDMEFDTVDQAENALTALREVWKNVEGKVIFNPQTRIIRTVEALEL